MHTMMPISICMLGTPKGLGGGWTCGQRSDTGRATSLICLRGAAARGGGGDYPDSGCDAAIRDGR
jgi:hypothetical protein